MITAPFGSINIESSDLVPPGKQVLWRGGRAIWTGSLGAPIEDVEFDRVTLNPTDYERVAKLAK